MAQNANYPLEHLYERDGGLCWLCTTHCSMEQATRDHVIPAALGGAYSWHNFALAHYACNQERADRFPVAEFQGIPVHIQKQVWEAARRRCKSCGCGDSLLLYLRYQQPPTDPRSVLVLCTSCRNDATSGPSSSRLTLRTSEVLPRKVWNALRVSLIETAPAPACGEQPEPEPAPLLMELPGPADPVEPEQPEPAPAPQPATTQTAVVPAQRPAPRFTPLDHARQAAAAKALRERKEAELAAAELQRQQEQIAAQTAAQDAEARQEPRRPGRLRRVLQRLLRRS
jgi:hypothetical protein